MSRPGARERRSGVSLRVALRLVGAAGLLVPPAERRHWREQWNADLVHRARQLGHGGAGFGELPRRALGAFAHAAWLLGREWRVGAMWQDVRYGLRAMRRRPGFTLVAVLVAGLGIGANVTIFSWIQALLLDPLPGVAEPGRLLAIHGTEGDRRNLSFSWPNFEDLRRQLPAPLDCVLAQRAMPLSVRLGDRPERVWGALVGGDYFETLGVRPVEGRSFLPGEADAPGAAVVLVGHSFWRQRLGGDRRAVGSTLSLNGRPFTVVGVLPPGFRGAEAAMGLDLYVPMAMQEAVIAGNRLEARGDGWLDVVGRLAPGATLEEAQASLDVVAARLAAEYPMSQGRGIAAYPLWRAPSSASGILAPALGVLAALVGVVLLIACVNVANLLLARAASREREVAVRLAVGASRTRLVRQLLTESLLLATAGGLAGIAMAAVTSRALTGLMPPTPFPIEIRTGVSLPLLAFGTALSMLTGVLFGLAPALQATRADLVAGLKQAAGALGGGRRPARLRQALVVGQLALSMLLLASAGLFLRTLWNARAMDPGYAEDLGLLAALDLQPGGYSGEAGRAFHRELLRRVEALPGVRAASLATHVPLSLGGASDTSGSVDGYQPREDERLVLYYNRVSPGYFESLGVPIVAGRPIDARDTADAPGAVVINQAMASRYWPPGRALGGRLRLGDRVLEVVGIAQDGRYLSIDEDPINYLYLPLEQFWRPETTLHVATTVDPRGVLRDLQRAVAGLDPELPLFSVRTLAEHRRLAVYLQNLVATLLGAFGLLALTLAAVGVYGVVAQSVSRRTQEIGVRMALGASRAAILRLVLGQGARLVALGLLLGGAAGLAVAPLFASQLVGVGTADPLSFGATAAVLAAAALVACAVPAWRGAAVQPLAALRDE